MEGRGVEVVGVCSLILKENVEEINLNYKDKASLESGSGNGYTGKGHTGNKHYGSCFFLCRHVSIFLSFLSSEDAGATLYSSLRSLIHWKASWPRLGPRSPPCTRATDGRCLGLSGNIRCLSPLKLTK